jgi:hypothetical protein
MSQRVIGFAWIRSHGPVRRDSARPMRGLAIAFVVGAEHTHECSCDAILTASAAAGELLAAVGIVSRGTSTVTRR